MRSSLIYGKIHWWRISIPVKHQAVVIKQIREVFVTLFTVKQYNKKTFMQWQFSITCR